MKFVRIFDFSHPIFREGWNEVSAWGWHNVASDFFRPVRSRYSFSCWVLGVLPPRTFVLRQSALGHRQAGTPAQPNPLLHVIS